MEIYLDNSLIKHPQRTQCFGKGFKKQLLSMVRNKGGGFILFSPPSKPQAGFHLTIYMLLTTPGLGQCKGTSSREGM